MKPTKNHCMKHATAGSRSPLTAMRLLGALLAGLLALTATACGGESQTASSNGSCLPNIRKNGLTVAFDGAPPASTISASGGPVTGLMPDIFREFIRRENIKTLKPVTMPFSSMISAIKVGRIDFNGTEISYTPDRAKEVAFVNTLYWDPDALIVKKGNPRDVHSLADLAGLKIGTYSGTIYADYLHEAQKKYSFKLTLLPSPKELLAALHSGQLDVGMMEQVGAAYAIKNNPSLGLELASDYKPASPRESAAVHLALRKQCTDLKAAFDKDFAHMVTDGTRDRLLAKWGLTPPENFTRFNGS